MVAKSLPKSHFPAPAILLSIQRFEQTAFADRTIPLHSIVKNDVIIIIIIVVVAVSNISILSSSVIVI